ncbi:DUF4258 domain-containing protein [Stenotrophomonas maltophilia]|uniref:DUF4258 domain-containing protein n=3 Tax=Stenotrophomonas TaxID=40323 RepID=A0A0R0BNN4_9GAMM|nr:DUF4258 domain-containing protein [Stenotrophomonas maltophilia]KOO82847.1 hypothetical protein VL23_06165 [Stenotrophomonas maltophilia]KRG55300.1 hypothetical protein ABB25_12340 [Stenotrophomonas koreensis]
MRKTVHFEKRMSQRGINKDMVQLVMEYGEQQGDKLILNRKAAERLMHAARTLAKILDKGGLVVVAAGESQLTTYNYEGRSH